MAVVGSGHQDHVHPVVRQDLLEAAVGEEALLPGPLLALLLDVVGACQHHLFFQVRITGKQFPAFRAVGHPKGLAAAGGDGNRVAAAHAAAADDGNSYLAVDHR